MSDFPDKDGPDKDQPDQDLPDEQLDEYLRGGSAVSRQYGQLPSADVPAELDRLVLRQAQQAVKARPAKSHTWRRWTGPLALAASAVLVISIVIESGVHDDTYLTVPASAPAEITMKQEIAEEPAAASAEKRAAEADEAQDEASVVHVVPVQPPIAEMALPMAPAAIVPEAPAQFQDRLLAIQPAVPVPAPAAAPARAAAPQIETAPIEEVQVQSYRRREVIQDSPTSISTARDADEELQQVIVTGISRPQQKQTAGPRNTVVAPSAADSSNDAAGQEAEQPRNYSDPEQWLRDIRELRKQNKHEEADREWRRFRYVFPNYEVAENDTASGAQR